MTQNPNFWASNLDLMSGQDLKSIYKLELWNKAL